VKTKTVYVAATPVYLQDKRGNATVLPVGHELSGKAWSALNAARQAKFTRVEKPVGRGRFGGVARDLPVIDGVVKSEFRPGEYHLLPVMVHDLINEIVPMWEAAYPEIPFPGVGVSAYQGDNHLTWWVLGANLPATVGPMYTTTNHLCSLLPKRSRRPGAYPYRSASLLKTAERLRAGRPVFATAEEAADRTLAL